MMKPPSGSYRKRTSARSITGITPKRGYAVIGRAAPVAAVEDVEDARLLLGRGVPRR